MASTEIETVGKKLDQIRVFGAIAIAVLGVVGFYALVKQGAWLQWATLLLAVFLASGVFCTSDAGKKLMNFGHDSIKEARKVVWPEPKEALQMTGFVFAFVVIMALFLWVTDKLIEWAIFDFLLKWK